MKTGLLFTIKAYVHTSPTSTSHVATFCVTGAQCPVPGARYPAISPEALFLLDTFFSLQSEKKKNLQTAPRKTIDEIRGM